MYGKNLRAALIFLFFTTVSFARGTGYLTGECIIGVPKASEKNLHIIEHAFSKVEGVKLIRYCPQHNLFLIRYDEKRIINKSDILRSVEEQNIFIKMFIKEGKFNDVKDICDPDN